VDLQIVEHIPKHGTISAADLALATGAEEKLLGKYDRFRTAASLHMP
jgi:hypothetical protein